MAGGPVASLKNLSALFDLDEIRLTDAELQQYRASRSLF